MAWSGNARLNASRGSKYGSVKTEVDGIVFHSKKEANRYTELRLLEKAGEIANLRCQFPYELSAPRICVPHGDPAMLSAHRAPKRIGKYIADFIYYRRGQLALVVEDVKGFKTPLYRWKKKHVEAQYGIQVIEI